jgi:hypothetical protein
MKKIFKKFPLTVYAIFVVLFFLFVPENAQYDSGNLFVLISMFILPILALPLIGIMQIYRLFNISIIFGITVELYFCIPLTLIVDFTILFIRASLLKSKNSILHLDK